jgi:hypothetical protein
MKVPESCYCVGAVGKGGIGGAGVGVRVAFGLGVGVTVGGIGNVPGAWVAGNVAEPFAQVITAAATGLKGACRVSTTSSRRSPQ